MGCSQSTNQVAPAEKGAAPEKKALPDFASTTASGASPSLDFNSIGSDDSGIGIGQGSRPNVRAVKFFASEKDSKVRRLSVASLVSYTSTSADSTTPSPLKMALRARLDGFSIDTSRAKSNSHVVSVCSSKLGLEEFPEGRKDGRPASIYWHNVVYSDLKAVVKSPESRVNKFPGMTDLARKISLTQSIRTMHELFPDEYTFYPKSWVIPAQLAEFKDYCAHRDKLTWFIVKPDDGAQGAGIYLITSPEGLTDLSERQLIQEYIDEPFLMSDRLKFDFRVYAVIKSINPLQIYIAREGMARFCTEKYEKPTSQNFENLYAHLTNYSLNKENSAYVHSNNLKDQLRGSKRLLSTVFHQMEAHGVRTRRLWHGIKMIVVKTVLAMVPEIMLNYEHYFSDVPGPQCFQIMGFDVIVKADGSPMLLEVNSAPSLSIDHNVFTDADALPVRSIVDEMIKVPLVRDTILLVLNQLDRQYQVINSLEWETKSVTSAVSGVEDDLALMKHRKRPHLSEIFPARYGSTSKHLLFLDKAVYLFMQFATVRLSMTINLISLRAMLKKCSLARTLSNEELERKYAEINYYFTGKEHNIITGLPFHGFLQLLFHIARLKFGYCDDLLSAMQRLLAYCDTALRHYGVRSTRLRRAEVELDENANANHVEIYLLPSRMRSQKQSNSMSTRNHQKTARFLDANPQQIRKPILSAAQARAQSLPRRSPPQNAGTTHLPYIGTVH